MSKENQINIGEDFIRFHKVITRSLEVAIQNVKEFLSAKTMEESQREGFLKFVQSFSSVVEGHHLVENEKVFPYFKDKIQDVPYERLMGQHEEIKKALDDIGSGIEILRSNGNVLNALKLIKSGLDAIDKIWLPHINIEETKLYGLVGSLEISQEEMLRIKTDFGQFFQEHSGPVYLVMPFLLYNLSPDDRSILAQELPENVINQLVPIDWEEEWAPMKPFLLS
ncbi:MAG TPA: hemerythrin domain-containing protein [Methanobacteriaceae archaeon]|nr:hemerythrin domain-containing protein [Methanobacteriaceae archaeon]